MIIDNIWQMLIDYALRVLSRAPLDKNMQPCLAWWQLYASAIHAAYRIQDDYDIRGRITPL